MAGKNKFKTFMQATGDGLLNEASKSLAEDNLEVVYIPRKDIRKNEKNRYSIGDIENLATLIGDVGLAQPLEVIKKEDYYLLVAGHRRITAIDLLIEQGKWKGDIPCFIKNIGKIKIDQLDDEEKEEYYMIATNNGARQYTEADYLYETERLSQIYAKLKREGVKQFVIKQEDEEGNIISEQVQNLEGKKTRELVADAIHKSPAQVYKYDSINKKGSPELHQAIKEEKISVATAAKVAKLDPEDQKNIIEGHEQKKPGQKITEEDIKEYEKEVTGEKTYIIDDKEIQRLTKDLRRKLKASPKTIDEEAYFNLMKYVSNIEKILSKF